MSRLCNLWDSWSGEFNLIGKIWGNKYPENPEWQLSYLEKSVMSMLILIRTLSLSHLKGLATKKETRTQISEFYVIIWFGILVLLLIFPFISTLYPMIIGYRLIEGFNYRLCIIFVDRYGEDWSLRSVNRSLMLLLINYFEMIIGFAAVYVWSGTIMSETNVINDIETALYFSIVTITTLGYGDYTPINEFGRFLVSLETIMGIVFIVLVLATFISGIPKLISKEK